MRHSPHLDNTPLPRGIQYLILLLDIFLALLGWSDGTLARRPGQRRRRR